MREADMIRALASRFRRSPRQANGLFECDAEILELNGQDWGLTLDAFCEEEDLWTLADPGGLGANVAVATLSDLLAAGAEPAFFLQAVSLPRETEPDRLRAFADGTAGVLDAAGCFLCGGDTGVEAQWRCTGFAMGPIRAPRPITRLLPPGAHTLWVTGRFGDANLAALRGRPPPRFELRLAEARAVRADTAACMDTSGGLLDALWTLRRLNPALRFTVESAAIPLAEGLAAFAAEAGLPAEAALVGGAGEYELLAALPAGRASKAPAWRAAGWTCIGDARPDPAGGLVVRLPSGESRTAEEPPCPRAAADRAAHVREAVACARRLFGGGTP